MKVSKVLKEYIKQQVDTAIPVYGVYEPYTNKYHEVSTAVEEANKKLEAYRDQLVEEIKVSCDVPPDWALTKQYSGYLTVENYSSELRQEENRLERQATDRRDKVLMDILLTLELEKVTKEQLNEVIQKAING